jgi:hypothetical protein
MGGATCQPSQRVGPSHENPHAAGAAQCRMAQRDLRQQNQCSLLPPHLNVLAGHRSALIEVV